MKRRLGSALSALALSLGLASAGLVAASPASAAGGNCRALTVSGTTEASFVRTVDGGASYRLRGSDLVGSTQTACSASSYRYDLVFARSNGDSWTTSADPSYNPYTGRTTVGFPSLLMATPSGTGTLKLTVRTWVYAPSLRVWVHNSNDDITVFIKVPADFSTTGTNAATGSRCEPQPDVTYPMGYAGWC